MRASLFWSLLLVFATIATTVGAEETIATDEAEAGDSPYQRHMRNGVKLFRDGDWDGAIAEFEAAYRAEPKASPLINLALTYKKLQDPARAVEMLEQAVRDHRDSMPADQLEAAEHEIREMQGLIAYVPVVVKPAEARLSVDGRPIAPKQRDKPLALSPGTRKLRAEAPGYRTLERSVRVVSGRDNAIVELVLEATVGEIVVSANDDSAWIEVDGKKKAQGSWRGTLPPGLHIIRVIEGDEAKRVEVVVQAGAIHNVRQQDDGALVSDAAIPRDAEGERRPFGPPKVPAILRGLYLVGGGGLLTAGPIDPGQSLRFRPEGADRFGGAVSAHVGYRVSDWAGFEAYGQFSDIRVDGQLDGDTPDSVDVTMILTSGRFGALMRLMLPGRRAIRFLSTFGGGGVYELLRFTGTTAITSEPYNTKETGLGFFVTLDLGVELEYENVLFALLMQNTIQTTKHFDRNDLPGEDNAFDTKPMFVGGPVLRVGYALW